MPDFAQKPVCSGPYKFVERVQNDRIVLERFKEHWNAKEYHFDRVVFTPIPDTTVRLANLRAGNLDILERLAPSDVAAVKGDPKLAFAPVTGIGYQGLTINTNNGERAKSPLGQGQARASGVRAVDRPRRDQRGRSSGHLPAGRAAIPACERLQQPEISPPASATSKRRSSS